jgi:hypothetical protein
MKDKPHKRESSQNKRDTKDKRMPATAKERERADKRLDEGIEETFPASDPVSVRITK